MPPADVAAEKARRRAQLRTVHARVGPGAADAWAAAIRERVLDLPELATSSTVAGYAAAGHELPTVPLLDELLRRGHRLLLPVVQPGGALAWREYAGAQHLTIGRYGLPEPDQSCPAGEISEAALVLVPALGFDENGTRLGRGAGYYDRLLARLPAATLTVGLAADAAVLAEIPAEPHDVPVDVVVTPTRTLRIISSRPL